MTNKQPEILCHTCKQALISFIDESISLDSRLALLSRLFLALDGCQVVAEDLLPETGAAIHEYLQRRNLLEAHFLGRSADESDFDESFWESERLRLQIVSAANHDPVQEDSIEPT
jgi:hypothetical protein